MALILRFSENRKGWCGVRVRARACVCVCVAVKGQEKEFIFSCKGLLGRALFGRKNSSVHMQHVWMTQALDHAFSLPDENLLQDETSTITRLHHVATAEHVTRYDAMCSLDFKLVGDSEMNGVSSMAMGLG